MTDNLKEREAFEAWATERSWPIEHDGFTYDHPTVQSMYSGWQARAAIEADRASRDVPAGWRLVPCDPTSEMWKAANKVDDDAFAGGSMHGADIELVWNAMLAAAPQPQPVQPSPWQPIDTAPKDGTAILLKMDGSDCPNSARYFDQDDKWRLVWDDYIVTRADYPLHWMPLQPPPAEQAKEE